MAIKLSKKSKNTRLNQEARRILRECLLAQIAFSAGVMILLIFVYELVHTVIWFWDDPFYRFLKFFEDRAGIFVPVLLICGWLPITDHFLAKVVRYLDEVAAAARNLAAPTSESIVLPDALHDTENELNRVREQALCNIRAAKEAEQRKNDLVAYLAHDLKTPLTSVIGYLTILKEEGQLSEALRDKYLTISLDKAERLEDLINEFFEITRFNLSNITLNCSEVNLTLLLQQLCSEFEPMLREKELRCELNAAPRLMIFCDVDKTQRVFDNLLRNAVNYSFCGSTISISAMADQHDIFVRFQNHGQTIPPEKLSLIFEQFYRMDTARSSRSGGTGLGLAIAKEIVERHGGTITAESEKETISFLVRIPQRQPTVIVEKS